MHCFVPFSAAVEGNDKYRHVMLYYSFLVLCLYADEEIFTAVDSACDLDNIMKEWYRLYGRSFTQVKM